MITSFKNTFRLLVLAAATIASAARAGDPPPAGPNGQVQNITNVPPLPSTPAAVKNLLYARPFKLEHGYESEWRAEKPIVSAGWLLVLDVDPALVYARQTAEPILYVGKTTGERVNIGYESGHVVVIVPSDVDDKGELTLDLNEALMWFGNPGLPEAVDAAKIEAERTVAANDGIVHFPQRVVDQAKASAADALQTMDRDSLRHAAAELIKIYSPQEIDLAEQILADQAGSAQSKKSDG